MGLQNELGFAYRHQNATHRGIAAVFTTRVGGWLGKWIVPFADRLWFRVSRERSTAIGYLAALPPIWLTTVGARTGASRRQPLLAFPFEEDLAIIGSNWGQDHHPGWVHNLSANPEVTVEYKGKAVSAVARLASVTESELIWSAAGVRYPGYAQYRKRAADRTIRVFILESL